MSHLSYLLKYYKKLQIQLFPPRCCGGRFMETPYKSIKSVTAPQSLSKLTLEEPNVSRFVLKGGVDLAGDPLPVSGGQRWVTTLQAPRSSGVPDSPHVARLKKEQLPSDHRDGVKVCLAGVRLQIKQTTL